MNPGRHDTLVNPFRAEEDVRHEAALPRQPWTSLSARNISPLTWEYTWRPPGGGAVRWITFCWQALPGWGKPAWPM